MNTMNIESDDGTLMRPSAPKPFKRWCCWCFPERSICCPYFPEWDYDDTAWYRRKTLQYFGLFTFLMFLYGHLLLLAATHAQDDLSNIKAVLGSPPPNYEYLMESIPPTATATALDSLKVINTKALEGWVVDQFLSPGIIACTEANTLDPKLCPAILFKKPL